MPVFSCDVGALCYSAQAASGTTVVKNQPLRPEFACLIGGLDVPSAAPQRHRQLRSAADSLMQAPSHFRTLERISH